MNKEDHPDPLRAQIYAKMQEKTTEELLEIWEQHNRNIWTELAFDVIREILQTRIGEVPEPAITAPVEKEEAEDSSARRVRLAIWARSLSGFVMGIAVLISITQLVTGLSQDLSFGSFIIMMLGAFQTVLVGAAFFVILQAAAELLILQRV